MESLEYMNNDNKNLREYLLTIESEYKPQAYEQDNYYLIKYCLLDLRSLEPINISEKVLKNDLEHKIPDQLAKIIHETNQQIYEFDTFTYNVLINNGWLQGQYLFEAIPLKESISSLNDLLILPSSERAIIHYLREITENTSDIAIELGYLRGEINQNLNSIDKGLDFMNYLTQTIG